MLPKSALQQIVCFVAGVSMYVAATIYVIVHLREVPHTSHLAVMPSLR